MPQQLPTETELQQASASEPAWRVWAGKLFSRSAANEAERLAVADQRDAVRTQVMEFMQNELAPTQMELMRSESERARLEMHLRGILHAMELLPEFAGGKVGDDALNTKLAAAVKIYKAAMNAAVQVEAEQQRARRVSQ